jgi:hypothetical protein
MSDQPPSVIDDFGRCGNGISDRALKFLISKIHQSIERNPSLFIDEFQTSLCKFDCPVYPSRILLLISVELADVPPPPSRAWPSESGLSPMAHSPVHLLGHSTTPFSSSRTAP